MTKTLSKAILLRLLQVPGTGKKGKASYQPDPKGAFEVQLNPTSLKISRTNNIDKGGATTNTQKRQTPSVQPATLAFDLEFDSAEGDGSGQAVDVRTLTHVVRQFTEPSKEKPQKPPPAVRFIWGTFTFTGIVTQLTEDLDYFSPDGRPLRAKVSVTITEQNPDWEAGLVGPAAKTAETATAPGGGSPSSGGPSGAGGAATPSKPGGTGPGAAPSTSPVSTALAQAGQSIQQLLAKMNADPATWRAAMAGLDSPLGLAAGAQVQLGASVSAAAGLGVGAGFAAGAGIGASASLRGALGAGASFGGAATAGAAFGGGAAVGGVASAGRGFRAGAGFAGAAFAGGSLAVGARTETAAGFVLAEAGGVSAAVSAVARADTAAAQAGARAAFSDTADGGFVAGATAGAGVSAYPSAGFVAGTLAGTSTGARLLAMPDPRALSYGRGIPLSRRVVLS